MTAATLIATYEPPTNLKNGSPVGQDLEVRCLKLGLLPEACEACLLLAYVCQFLVQG